MDFRVIPGMKVLFLNRRCIKHPEKGGAELYTMELAKALVENGSVVEWFSSKPKNLEREEVIEGVKFIRKGNEITTHIYGLIYALKKDKDWIIIDEINGIGFFTFFLNKSIILVHQLYKEFWTAELGFLGYPFRFLEPFYLKLYKNKVAITVSESTFQDLKYLGFKNIHIIENGLSITPPNKEIKKGESLTLVYVGRLKKTKNPQDAIRAFLLIKEKIKNAKLFVIGEGPLFDYLNKKYSGYKDIIFTGYLSNEEKYKILERSHFLLVPSIREGWGQVVIESNAFGTPAIGYNVQGLKDSIKNGKTGFLVKNHIEMANKIIELWDNKELYEKISKNCIEWSKNFSWGKTKGKFLKFLENFR